MPIQVPCACGRSVTVSEAYAGKHGKCPACGGTLLIPTPAAPHAEPVGPRAPALAAAPVAQPGLAMAGALKWAVVVLLVAGLAWGGWGVIRFFKRMNFDAYVSDGDNCLANGYPGEADTAYRRAQELFPGDPVLAKKFEEVAAYRKWKEEMSLQGRPVGSPGHEMVNRMVEMERRQREVEQRLSRPLAPPVRERVPPAKSEP